MFDNVYIRQVIDNLQKKVFEHTDGTLCGTSVVLAILCQKFATDEGKINEVIYLTQKIGLGD